MGSEFGGCIVCGVTLSADEELRCSDCRANGYMENTGTLAELVIVTENGPINVTATALAQALRDNGIRRAGSVEMVLEAALADLRTG